MRAIHDLFAGPGGWDYALWLLGIDPRFLLGFEWSPIASTTARRAGYARLVADISKLGVDAITEVLRGLIGSPPCQGFSLAGGATGVGDIPLLIWAIREIAAGRDPRAEVAKATADPRSVLVLEPLRWALTLRPTWIAMEQVPKVLPLWKAKEAVLQEAGYFTWSGILDSAQYDVPSSRKRAILLASRERPVHQPPPVRSRYHPNDPDRLDPGLEKWLSMEDVLPERAGQSMTSNYGTGGDASRRGVRRSDQPSFTVTSKIGRNRWSDGSKVSIREASILQTMSPDHPWYGTTTEHVWQQIGDMVPSMLGVHCLAALGVGDLDRAREIHLTRA